MMILNYEEAKIAHLLLLLLGRDDKRASPLTQTKLLVTMTNHGFTNLEVLLVVAKLKGWGLISRSCDERFNILRAGEPLHNELYSPELSKMYQLEVFAPVTHESHISPLYEVIICHHSGFHNWELWNQYAKEIQTDFNYRAQGARIMEATIKLIAQELNKDRSTPLMVNMPWFVTSVQYEVRAHCPLLSPLVAQIFIEHPYVRECLQMTVPERDNTPWKSRTSVAWDAMDIVKIPTLDECRTALQA
jgi:hypothetical protein